MDSINAYLSGKGKDQQLYVELWNGEETKTLTFPSPRGRFLLDEMARTCLLDWIDAEFESRQS